MGDQAGDRGAAGLVGVEDLAEEDPEGHQRGEDPVVPGRLDLGQGLGEARRPVASYPGARETLVEI